MWRLISAAVRASTSSRSSEAFTSSPISASVARTSAEASGLPCSAAVPTCVSGAFIESIIIAGSLRVQCFCKDFISRSVWAGPGRGRDVRWLRLAALGSQRKHAHVRHVAVAFGVVQAKANNKFIRNRKTDVIGMHRSDPALRLVQQHSDTNPLGLALFKNTQQVLQRHARVEDVFHHDYGLPFDAGIQVAREPYLPRGMRSQSVTRDGDEVKRYVPGNLPAQFGKEKHGAFQHSNQMQRLARKIFTNFAGHLRDAALQPRAGNQDANAFFTFPS